MKKFFLLMTFALAIALALGSCANTSDDNLSAWVGRYIFEEQTPDELWIYDITVFAVEDRHYATIRVDGGQTLRMLAVVQGDAQEITLVFMNNLPGNRQSRFHEGDALLSLRTGRNTLHTTWGVLMPVLEENQDAGTHFGLVDEVAEQ